MHFPFSSSCFLFSDLMSVFTDYFFDWVLLRELLKTTRGGVSLINHLAIAYSVEEGIDERGLAESLRADDDNVKVDLEGGGGGEGD